MTQENAILLVTDKDQITTEVGLKLFNLFKDSNLSNLEGVEYIQNDGTFTVRSLVSPKTSFIITGDDATKSVYIALCPFNDSLFSCDLVFNLFTLEDYKIINGGAVAVIANEDGSGYHLSFDIDTIYRYGAEQIKKAYFAAFQEEQQNATVAE